MSEKPAPLRIAPTVPFLAILIGLYEFQNAWLALVLYHAGIMVYLFRYHVHPRKLLHGWNTLFGLILIPICTFTGAALYLLWPHMKLVNLNLSAGLAAFGLSGYSWHLFCIYSIVVHPVLEELFWRGILVEGDRYPTWFDIWFAAYHVLVLVHFVKIPWLVIIFIILAFFAALWRYLALTYKGLVIPYLCHVIGYASIFFAAYLMSL